MGATQAVTESELRETLTAVFAEPQLSDAAVAAQVTAFRRYVQTCATDWLAWKRTQSAGADTVAFYLILPGRTAMLLTPAASAQDDDETAELLRETLPQVMQRGLHYIQTLAPSDESRHAMLEGVGFQYLTDLCYLQRDTLYPWFDPPQVEDAVWVPYDASRPEVFGAVLSETYIDTRDCPELTGMRPIDDVLASHRAAGYPDSKLWELARVENEAAGCLLLARLTDGSMVEIVYLGVVPRYRRRGLGAVLMRRALQHARTIGVRELTVAADVRNEPALQLYSRFGFKRAAQRSVLLCRG